MDSRDQWEVFVAVAEERGFAPAARRLGLSPPTVTRAVATLERRLGVSLFVRTTRVVRLTDAGRNFLPECQRLLTAISEAEAVAVGAHSAPRGELSVTAPVTLGRRFVAPLLFEFLTEWPELRARTLFVDRLVDLIDEGVDVAVRVGKLPDSTLTAVQVGRLRQLICAAPSYLDRAGRPRRPSSLERHALIGFPPTWTLHSWSELCGAPPKLVVNTVDVGVAAAVAGVGLVRVLSYQARDEIARGRLQVLLKSSEPEPVPVHLVHPEGRRAPAKVRAFIDFAMPRLRAALREPQPPRR